MQTPETLTNNHLNFIYTLLRRFLSSRPCYAHLEDDLLSEGMLALWTCAVKYKADSGVRFATYAAVRINGAFLDFIRSYYHTRRDTQPVFVSDTALLELSCEDKSLRRVNAVHDLDVYLSTLSEKDEAIMRRRYLDGVCPEDAAKEFGTTLNVIRCTTCRVFKQLRCSVGFE